MRPSYFVGLDLGQTSDFSALAVLEQTCDVLKLPRRWRYACRYLERWPLGTPYPQIVDAVAALTAREPVAGGKLVADQTGVGAAVVDLFRQRRLGCTLTPVMITAGEATTHTKTGWHVPKRELAAVLVALMQTGRLTIVGDMPWADALHRELATFQIKLTAAGNEVFGAERRRDHDDLVLAVALAAWFGERNPPAPPGPPVAAIPGQEFPRPY
jgi:hypothetical protein